MMLQNLARTLRRGGLALLLALPVSTAALAAAGGAVNTDEHGLAIKGYDPVSYHSDGGPQAGKAQFSHEWQGATWQFSSAKNRDLFAANPANYAPQYGGYCSLGTKMGLKIDIQPDQYRLVDGKLYINSSPQAHELWLKDVPGMIQEADVNWPEIRNQTPEALKAKLEG